MEEAVAETTETTTESTGAEQTTESTSAPETTTETATPTFRDGLSEANQAHASAEKFKDVDGFFKSYTELEGLIGKKGIIPPNVEDPADVARYNAEMGVPDSADKYELDAPDQWAQDMKYDQSVMKNIAHEANLTPAQAKAVEKAYLADTKNTIIQQQTAQKEAVGKAEQASRSEEGEKFEENTQLAERVIDKFSNGDETFAKEMKDAMKANPQLRKQYVEIGGEFAEHRIGNFEVMQNGISANDAQVEIDAMRADLNGPYMSDKDPVAHDVAMKRMEVLYKTVGTRR